MISISQQQQMLYSTLTFRLLLDSLARPGKINQLEYPGFLGEPPASAPSSSTTAMPLNLYAFGAVLSLLDREVTFLVATHGQWLPATAPAVQWLALRSSAAVSESEAASFALFCEGRSGGLLTQVSRGTLLEPEMSTTAFYCVEQLASGLQTTDAADSWLPLELSGPGIKDKNIVSVVGLDSEEVATIKAMRRGYPLGVDVYLIDALGRCLGLPRTTRIQIVGQEE